MGTLVSDIINMLIGEGEAYNNVVVVSVSTKYPGSRANLLPGSKLLTTFFLSVIKSFLPSVFHNISANVYQHIQILKCLIEL